MESEDEVVGPPNRDCWLPKARGVEGWAMATSGKVEALQRSSLTRGMLGHGPAADGASGRDSHPIRRARRQWEEMQGGLPFDARRRPDKVERSRAGGRKG